MEHITKNEGGVITYIGPGCRYDTGEIPAEVGVAGVRALLKRVNAYEATGLEPEEVAKLAQDQQDGLVVRLPCKVGDTIYWADSEVYPEPVLCTVTGFKYINGVSGGLWVNVTYTSDLRLEDYRSFRESSFGKTVFLTRAEAEAALKPPKPLQMM